MEQIVNEVYEPIFINEGRFRYIILMGGRGAGRSTVASQFALAMIAAPEYFRCAIMRFILTDVRHSIYREIVDRAEETNVLESLDVSDNAMRIRYGVNTIQGMGFRKSSSDQKSKLKSLANFNTVIVEEADEIAEADFMQLDDSLRTTKGTITIMLMLNPPVATHWIIKRWFNLKKSEQPGFYIPELKPEFKDTLFIHTSFRDNLKNLSDQTITNYARYEFTKPDHYWNMVKGYVPEVVRGKIYTDWKEIPDVPHEARLEAKGLDFGFHPDPAALVDIYYYNGGYIIDEQFYQTDADNRDLGRVIKNGKKAVTVADNAEPKSIAEVKEQGIEIIPCVKGSDSVRYGIKKVQKQRISYTSRSKNVKREYESYAWKIDKDGEELEVEDPKCDNHAMSAIRYAITFLIPEDPVEEKRRDRETEQKRRETVTNAKADAGL